MPGCVVTEGWWVMVARIEAGKVYRVVERARSICLCGIVFEPGTYVRWYQRHSPKRLLVEWSRDRSYWSIHKVKESTLRMAVEEVEG